MPFILFLLFSSHVLAAEGHIFDVDSITHVHLSYKAKGQFPTWRNVHFECKTNDCYRTNIKNDDYSFSIIDSDTDFWNKMINLDDIHKDTTLRLSSTLCGPPRLSADITFYLSDKSKLRTTLHNISEYRWLSFTYKDTMKLRYNLKKRHARKLKERLIEHVKEYLKRIQGLFIDCDTCF